MMNTQQEKPVQTYWHVWTDEAGVSRQTLCELKGFDKESMGSGADEQWNLHLLSAEAHILFTELPVGWQGEWHENPEPQWIIPVAGKWFVETMDGKRVEMGPGDISFGGDQDTKKDVQGRKGHLSGTVGSQPAKLMIIQLKDKKWRGAKPHDFEQ